MSERDYLLAKADRDVRTRRRKDAALGSGSVLAGAGLAGGGVPGLKATRLSADFTSGPVRSRPANLVRARRGGAFGYRENAHSTLRNFVLSDEGIRQAHPGRGAAATFRRAAEKGKRAPEEKIISHLRAGRRASYAALGAGGALAAYGATGRLDRKNKPAVRKADERKRRGDGTALMAGGATGTGAAYGMARTLESQGRKWSRQAKTNFDEASRLVPALGKPVVKPGKNKILGRTKVQSVRGMSSKYVNDAMLSGVKPDRIRRAAKLHGAATNQSYFAHVYGSMGAGMRKIGVPAGLAATAAGVKIRRDQTKGGSR